LAAVLDLAARHWLRVSGRLRGLSGHRIAIETKGQQERRSLAVNVEIRALLGVEHVASKFAKFYKVKLRLYEHNEK
jgi:hypothetical protein